MIEIGRTAWSAKSATLAQDEPVEICVAPPPKSTPKSAVGSSSPAPPALVIEPSEMNSALWKSQMPGSMSKPQSHTVGLHEKGITPNSSQLPHDTLIYCYNLRSVYVNPGENYDVRSFLHSQCNNSLPLLIN
jgi:hypothetical protein